MKTIYMLLSLFVSTSASANCPYLVEGLKLKMKEYRAHRETNEINMASLIREEESCKSKGAVISLKAARVSEALTCQAQQDASQLNQEIHVVGTHCENVFSQLTVMQENLRVEFESAKTDLDDGLKLMKSNALIREFCAEDLKVTMKMADAFLQLEESIVSVKSHATTGVKDYTSLKVTGQMLAERTKALSGNCGVALEDGAKSSVGGGVIQHTMAVGSASSSASASKRGVSAQPSSDITGTKKAIEEEKRAESIVKN